MKVFRGKLVVIVQAPETAGDLKPEIESKGLKKASLSTKSL